MKLFIAIISIVSILSDSNCQSSADDDPKIVGGEAISTSDAPYQAALLYRGSFICGCSIISTKYLLSAAHCVHDYRDSLSVRVGTTNAYRGGEVFQIEKVIRHPMFSMNTLNNDFAILKLINEITLSSGVKEIVDLPRNNENIDEGTEVFVSGFGVTQDQTTNDHSLRGVTVLIASQSDCKKAYPKMITNKMMCAGFKEGKKDSCSGDSGGPMIRKSDKTLVGVVSYGNGCALPGFYGVYAKVSSVRNWIKSQTGI